jgi:ubiquinone/menaquinone biosynthesis C-methylase UbiE
MSPSGTLNENLKQHYTSRLDLGTYLLEALSKAGKDINNLTVEDLAPIDEFHTRGRDATLDLARAVGLDASKHVLDVGSGVGGPSRCIARVFGCRVTGVDLTDEFCRAATMLADRVGLSDLVSYRQGDALNLPFPDGTFDVVWSQHAAMNIPDKTTLYREMARVLKSAGHLAIYDVLSGPAGLAHFPLPWARTPDCSFLVTADELRRLLQSSGLSITEWEDKTDMVRVWGTNVGKKFQQSGPQPLGLHVLMGPDWSSMVQNMRRSVEEGCVVIAQVVAIKA